MRWPQGGPVVVCGFGLILLFKVGVQMEKPQQAGDLDHHSRKVYPVIAG